MADRLARPIHFGNTSPVQRPRVTAVVQVLAAVGLLLAGCFVGRTRGRAARARAMAGMARESAQQLRTPVSSLSGWIELMEERGEEDPGIRAVASHMRADLDRLDRVAHRVERIGREPQLEGVHVEELVDRVANYFRARVATLASRIEIAVRHERSLGDVRGDTVLVEWALEMLVTNSVDALAGPGGRITLSTASAGDGVRIRVEDDRPGIARERRSRILDPGFSKETGWGIGISLARRIVEENLRGRLMLQSSDVGAIFDIILR